MANNLNYNDQNCNLFILVLIKCKYSCPSGVFFFMKKKYIYLYMGISFLSLFLKCIPNILCEYKEF